MDIYGHNYGSEAVGLTQEHIDALKAGTILAWNDGEYTTFVCLVDEMPGKGREDNGRDRLYYDWNAVYSQ